MNQNGFFKKMAITSEVTPKKKIAIVGISLLVALLHFFTGPNYHGPFPKFVNGYLLDIFLPAAMYFLLFLAGRIFKLWYVRGIIVFAAASLLEFLQLYGVPIFGQTFDPLDFVMYGAGVLLAIFIDFTWFSRIR